MVLSKLFDIKYKSLILSQIVNIVHSYLLNVIMDENFGAIRGSTTGTMHSCDYYSINSSLKSSLLQVLEIYHRLKAWTLQKVDYIFDNNLNFSTQLICESIFALMTIF